MRFFSCLALNFGAIILIALAMPPTGTTATDPLPTLVVTASAEPSEAASLPSSVQVITPAEIKASLATNLSQLLQRTSATQFLDQPGHFSKLSLRGFSSNRSVGSSLSDQVILLIDGNRAGTGNINNIPLANVDRVEILRGPASVLYGGSAVGGVVNVILKRGSAQTQAMINMETGNFKQSGLQAGVSGGATRAGETENYLGYALGVQAHGASSYKTGKNEVYENTGYRDVGGSATLNFKPEKGTNIFASVTHQQVFNTGSPGDIYFSTPNSRVKDAYSFGNLEFTRDLGSGINIKASLYANQNIYEDINNEEYPYNSKFTSRMFGGKSILALPLFNFGRLALGLEYARHSQLLGGSSISEPNSNTDVLSAFAEHKVDFAPFSVQWGLRYDHYRLRTKETDNLDMKTGSENFGNLTYSVGGTWWALDWLGIKALVGSAYVPPNSMQLAGEYTSWGSTYVGNPKLKAEKSVTSSLGLEFEKFGFSGNAGYFFTHYKDKITTKDSGSWPDPVQKHYINADIQNIAGLEAQIKYNATWNLGEKQLTFAPYVSTEYLLKRSGTQHTKGFGDLVPYTPKYTALIGLGLGMSDFWVDLNAQTQGSQLAYDFSNYEYDEFSGFTLYNTRLTYSGWKNWQVYLDIQNITNKYYGYKPEFPRPGRTFKLGFRYDY